MSLENNEKIDESSPDKEQYYSHEEVKDPLSSLHSEDQEVRRKQIPAITPLSYPSSVKQDKSFTLKCLTCSKNLKRFQLKVYDTINKKNKSLDVESVTTPKRMATINFSSVNFGSDLIMTGGKFEDDNTCSKDCYKIDTINGELSDMGCKLENPRMHHSMITIIERGIILAVGGEDESGNLLDTCEAYILQDNTWKIINTLNNKGKNLGLCKFNKVNP